MTATRNASFLQGDIETELGLKPDMKERWALAAQKKRLSTDKMTRSDYPDLDCYSTFFSENAEASKTVNWYTIPEDEWDDWKHLGALIRSNFLRPVYTKKNALAPCVIFHSLHKDKIGLVVCVYLL